jgi:hypothetical protein
LLRRTPAVLSALLLDLPEPWLTAREGEGTWSAFDVVGHLCDGEETDWIPRARLILEHGDAKPFEPYDRFRHLSVDHGRTIAQRLERFARLRQASLEALASMRLTAADLDRPGRHPALGPVTLRQLLSTWTAHDLDHLFQISRVLAKRYRDDTGPWIEYLRVLRS